MSSGPAADAPVPLRLGWLDATTGSAASLAARMDEALAAGTGLTVGFVNPHVYVTAQGSAAVREHLDACDRVCVDGVGIALAHRLAGRGRVPRNVAEHLFRRFWTGCPHAVPAVLIGIEPDAIARAATALDAASAGPRVVATLDGFADAAAAAELLGAHPHARLVLIGAGSPRSEGLATLARRALPDAVVFHCGAGTLKTWAGTKRRAPAWLSGAGLEWLHRLVFEPHARARYLAGGPRFVAALLRSPPPVSDSRETTEWKAAE